MEFTKVVTALKTRFPLRLAEKWDNVGLLTEPSTSSSIRVEKILVTIDLTEKVMDEAIESGVQFIIAYHPPIFKPLKSLTGRDAKERIIVKAIEHRIGIYSPHTSLDSVSGGVNDWLASGLGEAKSVDVLQPHMHQDENQSCKLVVFVPKENVDQMREELGKIQGVATIGAYNFCSFNLEGKGTFLGNESSNPVVGTRGKLETVDEVRMEMVCNKTKLNLVMETINKVHPYETPAWEVFSLDPLPLKGTGQGRLVTLKEKTPLPVIVERIKKHIGLPNVRLALPAKQTVADAVEVQTVALCAGAGGEVILPRRADLYLTGEMRHHDVLAAIEKGTSVVLCEHTNTERGYLATLKGVLENLFEGKVNVLLSKQDADPLVVV